MKNRSFMMTVMISCIVIVSQACAKNPKTVFSSPSTLQQTPKVDPSNTPPADPDKIPPELPIEHQVFVLPAPVSDSQNIELPDELMIPWPGSENLSETSSLVETFLLESDGSDHKLSCDLINNQGQYFLKLFLKQDKFLKNRRSEIAILRSELHEGSAVATAEFDIRTAPANISFEKVDFPRHKPVTLGAFTFLHINTYKLINKSATPLVAYLSHKAQGTLNWITENTTYDQNDECSVKTSKNQTRAALSEDWFIVKPYAGYLKDLIAISDSNEDLKSTASKDRAIAIKTGDGNVDQVLELWVKVDQPVEKIRPQCHLGQPKHLRTKCGPKDTCVEEAVSCMCNYMYHSQPESRSCHGMCGSELSCSGICNGAVSVDHVEKTCTKFVSTTDSFRDYQDSATVTELEADLQNISVQTQVYYSDLKNQTVFSKVVQVPEKVTLSVTAYSGSAGFDCQM